MLKATSHIAINTKHFNNSFPCYRRFLKAYELQKEQVAIPMKIHDKYFSRRTASKSYASFCTVNEKNIANYKDGHELKKLNTKLKEKEAHSKYIEVDKFKEEFYKLPTEQVQTLAKDIFDKLSDHYEQIYDDQTLESNVLFQLLFRVGVDQHNLITARPQLSFLDGSLDADLIVKERFVFFPTYITSQIFKICDSIHKNQNVLIIGQRGLGKSHSVALYVFLKRIAGECRIIYIHNFENFIDKPFKYLLKQLPVAFKEDLTTNPEIQKGFDELKQIFDDDTLEDRNRINKLDNFITLISSHLEQAKIPTYLIIDQATAITFAKNESKLDLINDLIASMMLVSGLKLVQIGSHATKEINKRLHDHTEYQLKPPDELDSSFINYIQFLVRNTQDVSEGNAYSLTVDQIKKLIEVTGFSLLDIRLFFQKEDQRLDFDTRIDSFKNQRKSEIAGMIQDFLDEDDERYLHMALALGGLRADGKIHSFVKTMQVDQRLFYVETITSKEHRITAISPLAAQALQEILICPYNIDKTIQECWVFPVTLGLLLESQAKKGFVYWSRKALLSIRNKFI